MRSTELDVEAWLRRLRWLGIVVPLACIIVLHVLMNRVLMPLWPEHTKLIGWAIGGLGLTGFALMMLWLIDRGHDIVQDQNRETLAQAQRLAVLEERERIARELHDSVAQSLGVAHLRLRALGSTADLDEKTRAEVSDIASQCHESYQDVREAIFGLNSTARTERSFLESLQNYLKSFSRHSSIVTTLETDASEDDLGLSPTTEVQLIRVIQEALTNVRKHSGATWAKVLLSSREGLTRVEIIDDGKGFDPSGCETTVEGGYGLHTMRERTRLIGGTWTLSSCIGKGTRVLVEIPRQETA